MSGTKLSREGKIRLETMVKTNDGFEISEIDLQLRGPGNIEGKQQSGIMDLKIADLALDQKILLEARKCVIQILDEDPELIKVEHEVLKAFFAKTENGITLDKIS
jgi:ATP-dependent DNA helicase RecG